MSEQNVYDFLVIGAGMAGTSAAMYASRMNLSCAMVAEMPGGLITSTHLVENWPGIKSITGPDLAMTLVEHATSFGAKLIGERVLSVARAVAEPGEGKVSGFTVKTASHEYKAKTILIATGTHHRKLGIPGEKEYENKGVSYCALCDGAFYKEKIVCVVGGGDSAAKEALFLAEHASKVYIFVRKDVLRAEPVNADRIASNSKIEIKYLTEIEEIFAGEESGKVERVKLKNGEEMKMDGVFMAVGHIAQSDVAKELGVELNEKGEIKINRRTETNVPGVYAAGDVTDTEFKQAITGSAEGVTASYFAYKYLNENEVVV